MTLLSRRWFACSLLALAAARGGDASTPVGEPYLTSFDRMWTTIDREYSYFEYKAIDWYAVRRAYRPRAEQVRNDEEFISLVREVLSQLRDVHVWVMSPDGGVVGTYQPTRPVNWSAATQ